MESPLLASSSNTTSFAISNMDIIDQYIPQELQMPVGIVAAVILIIAIILGVTQKKGESKAEVTFKSPEKSAKISKSGTPINEKTGTVMTPAGRRSARLARRKEE